MVRVSALEASSNFSRNKLGLKEVRHDENEGGRFTRVFLGGPGDEETRVELAYHSDPETLSGGRNFGHFRKVKPFPWRSPGCPWQHRRVVAHLRASHPGGA